MRVLSLVQRIRNRLAASVSSESPLAQTGSL